MSDPQDTAAQPPAQEHRPKPGPRPVGPLEEELDVYPIRPPEEDPRWAVWTVWIWLVIALGCLLGLVVLIVLGFFY